MLIFLQKLCDEEVWMKWILPKNLWTGWCWSNFERLEGLAAPCNMHTSCVCNACELQSASDIWQPFAYILLFVHQSELNWSSLEICALEGDMAFLPPGWQWQWQYLQVFSWTDCSMTSTLRRKWSGGGSTHWPGLTILKPTILSEENPQKENLGCSTAWLGSTMPAASNVKVKLWLTITLRVNQWPLVHQYALQWLDNQCVGHRPTPGPNAAHNLGLISSGVGGCEIVQNCRLVDDSDPNWDSRNQAAPLLVWIEILEINLGRLPALPHERPREGGKRRSWWN